MNQTHLRDWGMDSDLDLSVLSPAERRAYWSVRCNGTGVREFARRTSRSPGTIGNLLRRAESKLRPPGDP